MVKSLGWRNSATSCEACVEWIDKYFKDCVCSLSGEISFGLGMVSLVCWGLAEIPQIITNFHTKSGQGVSLAFLLTWIVGDIFNLVGCLLESATLPTQFYTAVLYTATTVVLVLQILYYDYWLRWWKSRGFKTQSKDEEGKYPKGGSDDHSQPIPTTTFRASSPTIDLFYMSARSLASSGTPTWYGISYLGSSARSGPSGSVFIRDSSSEDEDENEGSPSQHLDPKAGTNAKRTIPRSAGYGTFLVGSLSTLPSQTRALMDVYTDSSGRRRILQKARMKSSGGNPAGLILGWIMAAIYIGGRLPQIYLNIKRGTVEGLSPLMFIFALTANATYVGSILVRSVEWERIRSNAPWLLDAIVCVLLDLFIIMQFAYYKFLHRRPRSDDEHNERYLEAKVPLVQGTDTNCEQQ